jgi:dihydrofolate reductase
MTLTLIVAAAENDVIGRDGDLPWHLPADLRFFKETTTGHAVVMGRRTWDSFVGALPGRRNIVLTRNQELTIDGADVVTTLDAAMQRAGEDDVYIAGGGEIYRMALPMADRILLTRVHVRAEGETTFPVLDDSIWVRTSSTRHEADDRHECAYTFEVWLRR